MNNVLNIEMSVIEKWAKGFRVTDVEDLVNELTLLDLLYKAGEFKPTYDWTKPNENLGSIYMTLKYRLSEQIISVGSCKNQIWDHFAEFLDSDITSEFSGTSELESKMMDYSTRVSTASDSSHFFHDPDESLLYDREIAATFDRFALELNTVDKVDLEDMYEIFGLQKRRANEVKVILKDEILKRAALNQGLSEEEYTTLKSEVMNSKKSIKETECV